MKLLSFLENKFIKLQFIFYSLMMVAGFEPANTGMKILGLKPLAYTTLMKTTKAFLKEKPRFQK